MGLQRERPVAAGVSSRPLLHPTATAPHFGHRPTETFLLSLRSRRRRDASHSDPWARPDRPGPDRGAPTAGRGPAGASLPFGAGRAAGRMGARCRSLRAREDRRPVLPEPRAPNPARATTDRTVGPTGPGVADGPFRRDDTVGDPTLRSQGTEFRRSEAGEGPAGPTAHMASRSINPTHRAARTGTPGAGPAPPRSTSDRASHPARVPSGCEPGARRGHHGGHGPRSPARAGRRSCRSGSMPPSFGSGRRDAPGHTSATPTRTRRTGGPGTSLRGSGPRREVRGLRVATQDGRVVGDRGLQPVHGNPHRLISAAMKIRTNRGPYEPDAPASVWRIPQEFTRWRVGLVCTICANLPRRGNILVLDGLDPLVPVKPTVRHGRRSRRARG